MTSRKNPPKAELRHTGDDAISGLTFAELMGLPDVPDHTAVQLFLSGADLGDAAKLRAAERLQEDRRASQNRQNAEIKAANDAERIALASRLAREYRRRDRGARVSDLAKLVHAEMVRLEPETGIKPLAASTITARITF